MPRPPSIRPRSGDWRSFRLDRLTAPQGTGARIASRRLAAEDAAAFVRAGFGAGPPTVSVAARLAAPAEEVRQRIGRWATVEPAGPGSCRVAMAAENFDWAVFALAVPGADVDEVHPPELLEHLHAWADRLGRATAVRPAAAGDATSATGRPGSEGRGVGSSRGMAGFLDR